MTRRRQYFGFGVLFSAIIAVGDAACAQNGTEATQLYDQGVRAYVTRVERLYRQLLADQAKAAIQQQPSR